MDFSTKNFNAPVPMYGPLPTEWKTPKFNTVVFDLGGVIINLNVPRCIENFSRLMGIDNVRNILGIDDEGEGVTSVSVATKQLMADYERGNISTDDFLQSLLPYCHPGASVEAVRTAWLSMLDVLPQERLDYIRSLRERGFKTYLLSNSNDLHWEPIYQQYRLWEYFDMIFASHQLHLAKPSEQIFRHVESEASIDSLHTVYVDDLEKNRSAASAYVGWYAVESIEELKQLLDN